MKKLVFLPLILLLFACGEKPDAERIIGKWLFKEVYENGKLVASSDVAKQEKLVEEQLKKQEALFKQMGMDVNTVKKQMMDRMKSLGKTGFEFTKKEFFEFKEDGDSKRKQEYKLDVKNKTITVLEKGKPVSNEKVKYSFEEDNLVLKMEKVKVVLVQQAK